MRYSDFRARPCPCCFPGLSEDAATHGLKFNRQTFYNNMRLWIRAGTASDLEGVDTMVRLGYLEKVDSREVFRNFAVEHPIAGALQYGSYNSSGDRLRMAYDIIFEPGGLGQGTSTLAHELRHRAFYIISVTPELEAVMPPELRNRWGDGYGRHQMLSRSRWSYETVHASPEHAMIYAVQHRDPMSNERTRRFFENPELENETVEYWRELYRSVESAVRGWFKDRVPPLEPDTAATEMNSPFELSAQERAFYETLGTINGVERETLAEMLDALRMDFLLIIPQTEGEISSVALEIAEAIIDLNFEVMPDLLRTFELLSGPYKDVKQVQSVNRILQEFAKIGISWRLMDIDTFSPEEFAALARLRPDLVPAVPVARVEPAQPTTAPPRGAATAAPAPEPESPGETEPTAPATTPSQPTPPAAPAPTVVVPTGNSIGLYQWAVSNSIAGSTIWELITSSVNTNTLRSNMEGMIGYHLEKSGLKFTDEGKAQLSALYTMLAAGGYDRGVVMQMLARVELVKR